MTHENLGIQKDSNQHWGLKNHLPSSLENCGLTHDLTHQMTHGFGRRKIAEMSVMAGISANRGENSFALFLPLFYTPCLLGQKQASILAEISIMAPELSFYYMTLKTGAL